MIKEYVALSVDKTCNFINLKYFFKDGVLYCETYKKYSMMISQHKSLEELIEGFTHSKSNKLIVGREMGKYLMILELMK